MFHCHNFLIASLAKIWKYGDSFVILLPNLKYRIMGEDVPANVEVFSNGKIKLCYWPLLGMWSTHVDFPREGDLLCPTERVKTVTYRAKSKLIVSGYTQNGNIFYLNQKITSGGEVNHGKVLVLIYPQSEKRNVSALIKIVKDW